MRKFWVLILGLILIPQAWAGIFEHPQRLEKISSEVPELKDISCHFAQEKVLPSSKVVIKSIRTNQRRLIFSHAMVYFSFLESVSSAYLRELQLCFCTF